jgi:hypothetical protein
MDEYCFDEITKTYAQRLSAFEIMSYFDTELCLGWGEMSLLEILKENYPNQKWREATKKEWEQKHLAPLLREDAKEMLERAVELEAE